MCLSIKEEFKRIKVDKAWSFAEYKPSDTAKWTHCYHRYPAKFIPQLVEKPDEKIYKINNVFSFIDVIKCRKS